MFQLINTIIIEFRECFKRKKAWKWFSIIVLGFMLRSHNRGITSILSDMRLKPEQYHKMLHFFRSTAYEIDRLYEKWIQIAMKQSNTLRIGGRIILIGDLSNVSKEGLRMPDIQKLHQDSQNFGKAEYIQGHNYGQVSAVIQKEGVQRRLPFITELQKSPNKIEGTKEKDGDSLVAQMIELTYKAVKTINEPVYVALDAYFSSKVALEAAAKKVNEQGEKMIEIITRAQSNSVGYKVPEPPKVRKRGQPRKYGDRVVLYDLFSDMSQFTEATVMLYGKMTKVQYLCLDLIWKPTKELLRFVAVKSLSGICVLMCSDLNLNPEHVIEIYGVRFKIETSFAEQKNDMGCFEYHFWTTALPKRKKWSKVEMPTDEKQLEKVSNARHATEAFVCLSTIATGILSIMAFQHNREIWRYYPGWIKTLRSSIPTIAVSKMTFAHVFHDLLKVFYYLPTYTHIPALLRKDDYLYSDIA